MVSHFVIYLVGNVKIINGAKDIISDGVIWVAAKLLVCGGVGYVSHILIDIKDSVHEAYSATFFKRFDG